MRVLIFVLGTLALTASCGGSSSVSSNDALPANTCNWPSCMASAGKECLPSGTCTQQGVISSGSANICYPNGVKEIIGVDGTFMASVTVKNGGTTCFTMAGSVVPLISGGAITLTLKSGTGTVIGTVTADVTANQLSVTCTGGQPVMLDPSCIGGLSAASACTQGVCTP